MPPASAPVCRSQLLAIGRRWARSAKIGPDTIGHILISLAIQVAVVLLWRNWGAGAAAGSIWAIAREITQAEYRWIEQYGHGLRANMPWWGGLDARVWAHADPWLDWIVPVLVLIVAASVAARMWDRRV